VISVREVKEARRDDMSIADQVKHIIAERGPRAVSPFYIPMFLGNMASSHIAIHHGIKGPTSTSPRRARPAPTRPARRCT
jgi:3-oxoacyl-(acyl-carrier-protein) synthase